jgi:hypothetical protein
MSGPSPKKPATAVAKPTASTPAKASAPASAPKPAATAPLSGSKRAAPTNGATTKVQVATAPSGAPVAVVPIMEESKEEPAVPEATKTVVQVSLTTAPASSGGAAPAGAPAGAAPAGAPAGAPPSKPKSAKRLRQEELLRLVNARYDLVRTKAPDAIVPVWMWVGYMKMQISKHRESKIYFSKINTNSYDINDPEDVRGHIIYQQCVSNLAAGAPDTTIRLIDARLKQGDPGFNSHFLQVQGPPMVISKVTGPLGTFRDPNPKLTANTENRFFPDQHVHMWSHVSNCYFLPARTKSRLIDSEAEAWERWLFVAQMNYLLQLIDSDELKKSLKPKPPAGKTKYDKTPAWYAEVLRNFETKFRLVKFDEYLREQKKIASGESSGSADAKSVKDVQRVTGGDTKRVNLNRELFQAGGMASIDSDDEFDDEEDENMQDGAATKLRAKKAAAAAAGPKASLEYSAEKFTAATEIELTKEQIDEYAAMQESNKNILNIMCCKLYDLLTRDMPGYKPETDPYRLSPSFNLGMQTKPVRVPIRMFPHPDSPMAPEALWPLRADTVDPHYSTGSISSRAQVFDYGKKRVLDNPDTKAKWIKQIEQSYQQSPETQAIPVLDKLYKERKIVLRKFNRYLGFEETPCGLLDAHHRDGDIESHIYHLRATLNAPVTIGGEQIVYTNLKLESISTRTLLRAPDTRVAEVLNRGRQVVGAMSYADVALTKHSLGEATPQEKAKAAAAQKMVIVYDEDDAASKDWSEDTREMMHDLTLTEDQFLAKLPRFRLTNAVSLVKALKAQCGLPDKGPGPFELTPVEADTFFRGMLKEAQSQVTDKAAKTGNHLQANLQASRQLKDAASVRKQLKAGSSAAAAAAPVATSAPEFGEDDDENADDMVDAGAEYE